LIGISSAIPKAADGFLTGKSGHLLRRLSLHPQLYPAYTKNTRRRVLAGFPYSVIFQEKADAILVVAVATPSVAPVLARANLNQPEASIFFERLAIGRPQHAAFGHDGGYVFRRRHVEGRVYRLPTPLGVSCLPPWFVNLSRRALLDGNQVAGRGGHIHGGPGATT